jgi:hypothetical protein
MGARCRNTLLSLFALILFAVLSTAFVRPTSVLRTAITASAKAYLPSGAQAVQSPPPPPDAFVVRQIDGILGLPTILAQINDSGSVAYNGVDSTHHPTVVAFIAGELHILSNWHDQSPRSGYVFGYDASESSLGYSLNQRDQIAYSMPLVPCRVTNGSGDCLPDDLRRGYAVFLYSNGKTAVLVSDGDAVPGGSGLVFREMKVIALNDRGDVLFDAGCVPEGGGANLITDTQPVTRGWFIYSMGTVRTVALLGDELPAGMALMKDLNSDYRELPDVVPGSFDETGSFLFQTGYQRGAIFRTSADGFSTIVATMDSTPSGEVLGNFFALMGNRAGAACFSSSLKVGAVWITRTLIADGLGRLYPVGSAGIWPSAGTETGASCDETVLSDSGNVFCGSWAAVGESSTVTLVRPDGSRRTLVSPATRTQDGWKVAVGQGAANRFDTLAFHARLTDPAGNEREGVGLYQQETLFLLAREGDPLPGVKGTVFSGRFGAPVINNCGDVLFSAWLTPTTGIFFGGLPRLKIPNGDFERSGPGSLPEAWTTSWSDPPTGAAYRYDSSGGDSWTGNASLRLHVGPGGGTTFVVSDPIPVAPASSFLVSARMRYSLVSTSDDVFLTVIQLNRQGESVGFNEVMDEAGEEQWEWHSKRIRIQLAPDAIAIRIRIGLVASTETYADVDSIR